MKHVEFLNSQGSVLRGYLHQPELAKKIVVMFHGFTGNKTEHNGFFRNLARTLEQSNVASLRMDYACNGESDGEFSSFRFDQAVSDAKTMLDYACSVEGIDEVYVLGFSMGGAIASLVCNHLPITKLMLWSPAGDLAKNLRHRIENAPKNEDGLVRSVAFPYGEGLVVSMEQFDFYSEAAQFQGKVCIVHGRRDKAVDYLCSVRYATTFKNAELHLVDEAGHGYDEENSAKELFSKTLNFFK